MATKNCMCVDHLVWDIVGPHSIIPGKILGNPLIVEFQHYCIQLYGYVYISEESYVQLELSAARKNMCLQRQFSCRQYIQY